MNVGDIQTRVKRLFGDESGTQITDDDIIRWINDAQRQIVLQNEGLLEVTATANVVAGQTEYTLPADLLILRGISYTGVGSLPFYQKTAFDEHIRGWEYDTATTDPQAYTVFAGKIILFPIPLTSVTNGLKLYYNKQPADVAAALDTPELPILYHDAIVNYCMKMAYELDEDFEAAGIKATEITSDIALLRGRMDAKKQDRYSTITILADDDW